MDMPQTSPLETVAFGGGTRDRADRLRGQEAQLRAHPGARAMLLWRGKPLCRNDAEGPALEWLPLDHPLMAEAAEGPIFLGLEGEAPRFAFDVSARVDPEFPDGPPQVWFDQTRQDVAGLDAAFTELRAVMADLSPQDAADGATARAMMEWHRAHLFCARCGQPSVPENAGWRRACPSCSAQHFPRTDPVVIQLITRGDKVLLGRQAVWSPGFWSLLAGFVEPGETIEAAVRRETWEETGIEVGAVRYITSQPWPFPSSLMFACAGAALNEDISIDENELEDARWVTREELQRGLAGDDPDLVPGRRGAIAHTVLSAWAGGWIEGA